MNKNYYEILGLQKDASEKDIKKAFRTLSLKYHPDRQNGKSEAEKKAAEEKFKEIAEAYGILSDKEKKAQYDTYGTVGDNPYAGMNTDDLFRHFANMSGFDFFGGGFGGSRGQTARRVVKGSNIRLRVKLSIEEAYYNKSKSITYDRYEPCSHCNGTGSKDGKSINCPHCHGTGMITNTRQMGGSIIQTSSPCPHCHGTGKMISNPCPHCNGNGIERKTVTKILDIPDNCFGNGFVIHGGGNYAEGSSDSISGDLELMFVLDENSEYTLINPQSLDLMKNINVSVIDCITGCDLNVHCPSGSYKTVKVKQGSNHGDTISIYGEGLRGYNGARGNIVLKINTVMPKKLSEDEIKTLNKLKENKNFKI